MQDSYFAIGADAAFRFFTASPWPAAVAILLAVILFVACYPRRHDA